MLVNKGRLQDTIKLQNILCVYSFHTFERDSLKLATYFAHNPELKVTILLPKREIFEQREEREELSLQEKAAIQQTHIEEEEVTSHSWTDYLDILFLGSALLRGLRKLFHINKKERTGDEEDGNKALPHDAAAGSSTESSDLSLSRSR